ncbi:MAG TPA: PAS domain-containing protein [Gemmatimonadaceae bacterium]|nr:PAS domain-containing protein [Gemmatimonadaceae bacterium]
MSTGSIPDMGDFAAFADAIHTRRVHSERVVRQALARVRGRHVADTAADLTSVSHELDDTYQSLDNAAEEIRVQNEALFAARIELEASSAFFRDLFELAPTPYVATNADTRIIYANEAACMLLRSGKNTLVGKLLVCFVPLDERHAFRAAVLRTREGNAVCTWPTTLTPRGAAGLVNCRMRVRPASASGMQPPLALYWNITEETDEDLF